MRRNQKGTIREILSGACYLAGAGLVVLIVAARRAANEKYGYHKNHGKTAHARAGKENAQ